MKTMKKTAFSVCATALLLFSACSKDEDKDVSEMSSAEISSMIVGTWQLTQDEWSYQMEGEKDSGVDKFYEGEYTWIFNNDNTWISRTLDIDDEDNDGEDNDIIEYTGRWSIENNALIISDNGEVGEVVIEKLTKNELIVTVGESYPDDDEYYSDRLYFKR